MNTFLAITMFYIDYIVANPELTPVKDRKRIFKKD